jgi:hypothetical protein
LKEVPLLSEENYKTGGWTALYDAITFALHLQISLKQEFKQTKKTIFLSFSYGSENASKNTTESQLKTMIDKRVEEKNCKIIYSEPNFPVFRQNFNVIQYVS